MGLSSNERPEGWRSLVMPLRKDEIARAVLDALDSGLALLDRERRVLAWNAWLVSATGIPPSLAMGQTLDAIFPGRDLSRLSLAIGSALDLGASSALSHALHSHLLPLRTRTGRPLIHNIAVRPIGEPPYFGCLVQVADITLAHEREAILRQRQNARYDAVVGSAPDAIMTFDAQGLIQMANPAAADEFGYPPQEMLGRRLSVFLQNPETWEAVWPQIMEAADVEWPIELVVHRRDGTSSYVDASAAVWRSDSRPFVTAVLRNVNERHAAEAELREWNDTLEHRVRERTAELERAHEQLRQSQKMDAIGQLTGGVAHDFNNLLTPIVGGLDILQRRGLSDERAQRLIDGALQSAERARVLVQRLLAFARRQPLRTGAVNVAELVAGMTDLIGSTIGPRIRVLTEIARDLPPVRADRNQLEMAMLNLAVNARDAMPDGGTLTISAHGAATGPRDPLPPGSYVGIAVTDTGEGMDADTLRRAVEPFFSTKGVGKGTGLGLSMIHGLAAQLGGSLELSSTPGLGTTVEIWLPVANGEAAAQAATGLEDDVERGAGVVLLVEDEDLVRTSTAQMLMDLGYSVIEASSGREAVAYLDDAKIRFIITDHLMPGITGTEFAREAQARGHPAPILIISGYAELEDVAPDLPRLTKPFRQAELAAALSALPQRLADL